MILLLCTFPITVWFVPNFPVPAFHFFLSVTFNRMFYPLVNQLAPFIIIFRRISPAGENFTIGFSWFPVVFVRFGMGGQGLWHKTYLCQWFHAPFDIGVKDAVNDLPVINGFAGCIFCI